MSARAACVLVAAALLAPACGDDSSSGSAVSTTRDARAASVPADIRKLADEALTTERESFVGKVEGTDAYAAVVTTDKEVTTYVCDGQTVALWFSSSPSTGPITATHPTGAALRLEKSGEGYEGTISIGGATRTFSATAASYPAGLWEGYSPLDDASEDAAAQVAQVARYGWIVLPDGTQRGSKVQQTSIGSGGTLEPDLAAGSDGTAATPSAPPPPVSSADAEVERCRNLAHQFYTATGLASLAPEDSASRATLVRIATNMVRNYYNSGCLTAWGHL